jgi:hypothetical protein
MPRVCYFDGISIYIYYMDHPPPHFHAIHGDDEAVITIHQATLLAGSLPTKALKKVRQWATLHEAELAANWDLAQAGHPLLPIAPLP